MRLWGWVHGRGCGQRRQSKAGLSPRARTSSESFTQNSMLRSLMGLCNHQEVPLGHDKSIEGTRNQLRRTALVLQRPDAGTRPTGPCCYQVTCKSPLGRTRRSKTSTIDFATSQSNSSVQMREPSSRAVQPPKDIIPSPCAKYLPTCAHRAGIDHRHIAATRQGQHPLAAGNMPAHLRTPRMVSIPRQDLATPLRELTQQTLLRTTRWHAGSLSIYDGSSPSSNAAAS